MSKISDLTEEHLQMIEDCQDRESRMSEWEESFVDSLSDWLGKGFSLTNKQAKTLEELWEKITKRG